MFAFRSVRLIVVGFALPLCAAASEGWMRLKAGMTRAEASAVVGEALITTSGRSFEVAVYDRCGEVVYLDGRVVTWSAPNATPAVAAPANTWQFNQTPVPAASRRRESQHKAAPRGTYILPVYRIH